MQYVRARPGDAVEDQEAQRAAGHIDPVADGVGAEQAGVLLGAEDVHQRTGFQRIDVLGVERQTFVGQGRGKPLIDRPEAPDGGEQAERPAAGGQEQLAHRRRHLTGVVTADIGDHDRPGVQLIVERRGQPQRLRPVREPRRTGAHLGQGEGVVERGVSQGGAGHQHPVRRGEHRGGQGLGRIDPMAAAGRVNHPAVHEGGVEPVDEIRIVIGIFLQRLQHRAPGRQHHPRAPVEAAQGAFDPGPVAGDQFVGVLIEHVLQGPRQGEQRRLDGRQCASGGGGGLTHQVQRRPGGALHAEFRGRGAGAQLLQDRHQEGLDRSHRADFAGGRSDAAGPAFTGQHRGRPGRRRQRLPCRLAVGQHVG